MSGCQERCRELVTAASREAQREAAAINGALAFWDDKTLKI